MALMAQVHPGTRVHENRRAGHLQEVTSTEPDQEARPLCRSNVHHLGVAAVAVGVFDASRVNGSDPEPGSAYCLDCAVLLFDAGMFTPTDGTVLPTPAEHLQNRDGANR